MRRRQPDPRIDRLRSCALFARLPDAGLAEIARITDEVQVPAGRTLTRQGEWAKEAFVITEGSCRVVVDGEDVATVGPGDVVGEMALLERSTRSATVITQTPVSLLALDPRRFVAMAEQQGVGREIMRQLSERLRRADERGTHAAPDGVPVS